MPKEVTLNGWGSGEWSGDKAITDLPDVQKVSPFTQPCGEYLFQSPQRNRPRLSFPGSVFNLPHRFQLSESTLSLQDLHRIPISGSASRAPDLRRHCESLWYFITFVVLQVVILFYHISPSTEVFLHFNRCQCLKVKTWKTGIKVLGIGGDSFVHLRPFISHSFGLAPSLPSSIPNSLNTLHISSIVSIYNYLSQKLKTAKCYRSII